MKPEEDDPELRRASLRLLGVVRAKAWLEDGRLAAVALDAASPEMVAALAGRFPLPARYQRFLTSWGSADFGDTGLTWRGVACWPSTAQSFEALHLTYAGQEGWPASWLVIAFEHEGCYFLRLETEARGDAEVAYLEHGAGHDHRVVAIDLPRFLDAIAEASQPAYAGELAQAVARHDAEAVQQALAAGAPRDGKPDIAEPPPLVAAALHGHAEGLSALLDAGAAVESRWNAVTALDIAVRTEQPAIVRELIARGALTDVDPGEVARLLQAPGDVPRRSPSLPYWPAQGGPTPAPTPDDARAPASDASAPRGEPGCGLCVAFLAIIVLAVVAGWIMASLHL
jgi:hypothetical protein